MTLLRVPLNAKVKHLSFEMDQWQSQTDLVMHVLNDEDKQYFSRSL